jgi:hypothetical protein
MIDWRQYSPIGFSAIDGVVIQEIVRNLLLSGLTQLHAGGNGVISQFIDRMASVQQA